ncbi:MAG: ATP-binding protein [Actinomycetota bacterium]|nr:ATP-binding protein [Actinomycetota bacterium]
MIGFALLVAVGTLAAGLLVALGLKRLPTVRLQLAGLALVAVLLPLGAVVVSGLVMFQSGHDLTILAVAAGSACAAIGASLFVGNSVSASLSRLARVSGELEQGDLTARAPVEGPAELRALAGSFNEMAVSIERLFDARRELVAWASHDLRTPLANMQAMLEALEDGLAEPEEYIPALRDQVRALSALTDDLFELARIDSGALTLELREAELAGLVHSCLRGVEAEARSRHVRLEARVGDSVTARCAPEKVERVLGNLLVNALRHTPSDGSVAVLVEQDPEGVRVTVEDTGDGLSPESLRRMFERFWRGDPARSARGAGLGLAIARGLVEAHGGRIWAENRPDGGARVSFTLPSA